MDENTLLYKYVNEELAVLKAQIQKLSQENQQLKEEVKRLKWAATAHD